MRRQSRPRWPWFRRVGNCRVGAEAAAGHPLPAPISRGPHRGGRHDNTSNLAVHRLRFALPAAFRTPGCCDGESGMLHVRVKAADANGKMLVRPYSAHVHPANQTSTW